jgi:hypothetical protein
MAHFPMLSDLSVNLVVHRWLDRFLLNEAEDTPSTLNEPGDVTILSWCLGDVL